MDEFITKHQEYSIFMDLSFDEASFHVQVLHKSELPENHRKMHEERGNGFYTGLTKPVYSKTYIDKEEVPYAVIDQVPALESCWQLSGEERKQCTSIEVAKFVNKNFRIGIASEFGFVGKQRISVLFKIDEDGNVFDARARATHQALEDEAVRVINALPQFIPGEHNGEAVVVPYSLPIVFEIK